MLRNAGLTRLAILPLSAGLLTDTEGYFDSLNMYRTGEIEPVVSTFVDAVFRSLDNSNRLAQDLTAVRDSWSETISARADSTVLPLLDYCLGRPAVTVASVAADLGVSTVAAQNAIDRLAGVEFFVGTHRQDETGYGWSPTSWTQSISSWNAPAANDHSRQRVVAATAR